MSIRHEADLKENVRAWLSRYQDAYQDQTKTVGLGPPQGSRRDTKDGCAASLFRLSLHTHRSLAIMSAKTMAEPAAPSGSGNKPLSKPAHALTYEAVIGELEADDNAGLSADDAKKRLDIYGSNDLGEGAGVQPGKILLRQVANAMTLVT